MKPRFIIVRQHLDEHSKKHHHEHHHESDDEKLEREYEEGRKEYITDTLESMKGYTKYVERHGHHFTDSLAEWASGRMKNRNGETEHHWSVSDVKGAFEKFGLHKPEKATWGDATYAANMAYADYIGSSVKTDVDAVRHGYDDIADPDGYPGKVFNRWTADVIGMDIDVPWEKFI